ncbi:MAG: alpha-hydroxy-acid oxidizing protein [Desulfobacteraceae bacterium]|nr:MAG: alpha-hydroxy-acid oxidizing protein [Desulfobacteraceae bacterium]
MSGFETIQEIVSKAYRLLPPDLWDHISGGAESETTLKRNRHALDRIAFKPRVLRDVTKIDTSTDFLGVKLRIPLFFAPLGGMDQFHPEGGLPCLRAASRFGTMTFLSSVSQLDLPVAANTGKETLVYQLYVRGDDAWMDDQIRLVKESGCRAFCLTVDTAIYSRRERDLFNRYAPPGRRGKPREGFQYQAGITWEMVDRIRNKLRIPIILKGIATAEDAWLAVEHGIDVVYVSNHGGRQLDHCRGSIDVLPEVADAVGGKAEILVDGGFLRGTDVLKAVALGARAVGIGKLQAWALAAGGEECLTRMLEILETEIASAMALLGVTALDQLDSAYLHPETAVNPPDEFSAFPTLARLYRK